MFVAVKIAFGSLYKDDLFIKPILFVAVKIAFGSLYKDDVFIKPILFAALKIAFGSLYKDDVFIKPIEVISVVAAATLLQLVSLPSTYHVSMLQCRVALKRKTVDINTTMWVGLLKSICLFTLTSGKNLQNFT